MEFSQSDASQTVADIAARHGVSTDAVETLLRAILAGGGAMAQFSHPDLGGMGQWSRGGMIMVGDMFNQGLKYRVDALCSELSDRLARDPGLVLAYQPRPYEAGSVAGWWPNEFGSPSSSGSQNDFRYAIFPALRRLVIQEGGETAIYDTGDNSIGGISQHQGGGRSWTFTSQFGTVGLSSLRRVDTVASPPVAAPAEPEYAPPQAVHATQPPAVDPAPLETSRPEPKTGVPPARTAAPGHDDIFVKLERLAELHAKGILTEAEFSAKKTELLDRL